MQSHHFHFRKLGAEKKNTAIENIYLRDWNPTKLEGAKNILRTGIQVQRYWSMS
ncbi:MAG: hypothetical protein LUQ38_04940 [Methanotrichaceae archaeon]|nr:hypothetical protein [Methanotrichaceae archaeon]